MWGETEALRRIISPIPSHSWRHSAFFKKKNFYLSPSPSLTWFVRVLSPPEHQNHARELVRKADLSQWDALVIMSGDGLLFEVGGAFSDDR